MQPLIQRPGGPTKVRAQCPVALGNDTQRDPSGHGLELCWFSPPFAPIERRDLSLLLLLCFLCTCCFCFLYFGIVPDLHLCLGAP